MVLLAEVTKNPEFSPESSFVVKHRRAFVSSSYSQGFLFGGKIMEHLCECGCGERVKWNKQYKRWNRFINRNNQRTQRYWNKQQKPRPCKCGCGGLTQPGNIFILGHTQRGKVFSVEHKRKIANTLEGHIVTEETRKKISIANTNPSEEIRRKISEAARNISDETRKRMSLANRNPSEETRKRRSEALKNPSKETRLKIAVSKMKCRVDGYCDVWSDKEYTDDLRKTACDQCGITDIMSIKLFGRILSNHHIDGNKMNCHPSNFKTLCCSCHARADALLRKI